ncbi:TIGR02217 family protein [Litorimonas sp. RW-G-Af-16]|uniref:phage distal tail protein, Rcc01695 family n=1 Tax=Litorimonas sp. RW-G-Af-16 TaxID=3241168 RepID=UPI00390C9E84
MSDFHNVHFPWHLAFGSRGGPERFTDIVELASGAEARNTTKRHSRRQYQATIGVKSYEEVTEIISFFEERRGRLHAFRFRDKTDFSTAKPDEGITATDEVLGISDGQMTQFQLMKSYGLGAFVYHREITKPRASSVVIAIEGMIIPPRDYTVSDMTGIVKFSKPLPAGAVISAGFEFDVPVRFDTDKLDIVHDDYGALQISELPLIEVFDHG